MTSLHPMLHDVTERIRKRSADSRAAYLEMIRSARPEGPARQARSAGNLAHASAGCVLADKTALLGGNWPNIGIVTAYNDMLSAHQPLGTYPDILKQAAREVGATAQIAGGVPAMCDGVTQGQDGMELSLFSRDVIAMASGISLSHNVFDAALHLGVCDKIVPGLLIAALRFGWLPSIFVPAGPMPSGLPNPEKSRIRQAFAEGRASRADLLKAEADSYHAPGTCTFYGTANSNQMLMEIMGLHLPGAAFVPPGTPLREALTAEAARQVVKLTALGPDYLPAGEMMDACNIVNGMTGLCATGGSTNHMLHIPAMAAAAGWLVTPDDFAQLSSVTPLLTRIYPNGDADINHFHAAGGMGFVINQLLKAGLMHGEAHGVCGLMAKHAREPFLSGGDRLEWRDPPETSGNTDILRPVSEPFDNDGGLRVIDGSLGRGVCKVSALKPEHRKLRAPAQVFSGQDELKAAFQNQELNRDFVAVVRFQGPAANGMPELHALSPILGALQDRGHRVALVTDGRMSGASGKVPSAIHIAPEAARGGALARVRNGDIIRLDCNAGSLEVEADLETRESAIQRPNSGRDGAGQSLFSQMRSEVGDATSGASFFSFMNMGEP